MFHALDVAGMVCPNNVFLAPMAGYTDLPFRTLCEDMGAGLTFTEMVSAKGLLYGSEETKKLLLFGTRSPKAVQIFGGDPDVMRAACENEALAPFDLIDINMGCPVPKIVKNGEGSALLGDPRRAERIVAACAASGKRVSVKIRIGFCGKKVAAEFARIAEGAGACLLTVHGRMREAYYSGEPDFGEIARAKAAVRIPVIANGGIACADDARRMLERTGADGVMIGRAALADPRLFCAVSGREAPALYPLFARQLAETRSLYGDRFCTVFMRKMAGLYLKGGRDAAKKRARLFTAKTPEEVDALAREYLGGL